MDDEETVLPKIASARPVSIADLLISVAFVAMVLGLYLPGSRLAFNADDWLIHVPYSTWGPIGLMALIGCLVLPAAHVWIGLRLSRAMNSWLLKMLGFATIFGALPTGAACLTVVGSVGGMIAG